MDLSPETLGLLFAVAVLAGFIDTLAGGGGLVALPALLMAGIPPLAALGTNKLQGCLGTATASVLMVRSGRARWREVRGLMALAFLGSMGGTVAVQWVDTSVLRILIPIVLIGIALYFLLAPQTKVERRSSPLGAKLFSRLATPTIGWYDGMFGPGTGSFFALAGVGLRGQDLVQATAIAKTLNFATNLASLGVFLIAGKVVWLAGGVMMVGQVLGAWLGSHFLLRIRPGALRAIVVVMCLAMLGRYGFEQGWWASGK